MQPAIAGLRSVSEGGFGTAVAQSLSIGESSTLTEKCPPDLSHPPPGLPHSPVEARERLAVEGVTFNGARASEACRYTVEQWREAGCPSGAHAAAAHLVAELAPYVESQLANLPERLEDLVALAKTQQLPADAVAVNLAIIQRAPQNVAAHNQLGRAYQDLGLIQRARAAFETVLQLDPGNAIATKRLHEINRLKLGH
jgi:tetratricopeptide (TPR) repeat protein